MKNYLKTVNSNVKMKIQNFGGMKNFKKNLLLIIYNQLNPIQINILKLFSFCIKHAKQNHNLLRGKIFMKKICFRDFNFQQII